MKSFSLERGIHVVFILYLISLVTSMSGMELFSSLLAVGLVLHVTRHKIPFSSIPIPPMAWPMIAFTIVAVAGILRTDNSIIEKWADIRRMRFFLIFAILYAYFYLFRPGFGWRRWLFWACVVVTIYGSIQHFIPLDILRPAGKKVHLFAIPAEKIGPLVVGAFNHHLTFANIFFLYACVFSAVGIALRKYASLALGAILFLLCLWTQSRAAWAALPISALILALPSGRKVAASVGLAVVVVLAILYGTDPGFRERLRRTAFGENSFYQLADRKLLWRLNWELFKDAPLLGYGFNNNERHCAELMKTKFPQATNVFCGHAHSTPLQILATTGLLGFLAYCWIWLSVFANLRNVFRQAPRESENSAWAWGLVAGFVGFHIQGLTQWNFGDAEVLHNIMFLWALTASLSLGNLHSLRASPAPVVSQ